LKTLKIGFIMGFGIGLMTVSAIMFAVAMSDLNKTEETKIQDEKKDVSTVQEDTVERSKETTKEIPEETTKEIKVLQENKNEKAKLEQSEEEYVAVIIPKGSDSYDVAKILYDNKLIENKNGFEVYIEKQKKSTMLRHGTFNIKKDSSYDDIIKKIAG